LRPASSLRVASWMARTSSPIRSFESSIVFMRKSPGGGRQC
jgi:hypothetical protein